MTRTTISFWSILAVSVSLFSVNQVHAEEDTSHYPEWSWDRVPVALHFGSQTQMSDEQIQTAAEMSNLICLEKNHGRLSNRQHPEQIMGTDAKRIKQANPNAKVLYYWNTLIAWPFTSYNRDFAETHPNDWTLRDLKTGEPLLKSMLGDTPVYQYNLLNPETTKWWVDTVASAVKEFGVDGVYMDATTQSFRPTLLKNGWGENAIDELTQNTSDMMTALRSAMGSDRILIYNGLRSRDGKIDDATSGGAKFLPHADGTMIEHFDQFASGTKEDIVMSWRMASKCAQQRKIVIYKAWPGHDANFMNEQFMSKPATERESIARRQITFPLACFLIGAEEHSYFCYGWGYDIADGQLFQYAEYDSKLGKPQGPARREGQSWVFTREFEHCKVRVDLESRDALIHWDSGKTQSAGTVASNDQFSSKPNPARSNDPPQVGTKKPADENVQGMLDQVLALGKLTAAPKMHAADEIVVEDDNIKPIYFDALPWKDKPTRVFAWVGMPKNDALKSNGKYPGVVLVHGGGGTAFKLWVEKWTEQGFAAVSIAVEGQTEERFPAKSGERTGAWKSHAWAGPARVGIYGDSEKPLADQWMYHAVADTVLANSLLRSLPEVDENKVGLMGVSWGGVITSTVIGVDNRFAFAIPTYGCGHLADAPNQYGRALGGNNVYREVWDPVLRLDRATMPTLWFSWPGDEHFPLDCQATSYRTVSGPRSVSLVPGMRHGHGPAWLRGESYAFAKSVVESDSPWCAESESKSTDDAVSVTWTITGDHSLDSATLVSTTDDGPTGPRKWNEQPAKLKNSGNQWTATASLPKGTTSWFLNVTDGDLISSSEYVVTSSEAGASKPMRPQSGNERLFARIDTDSSHSISIKEYTDHYRSVFEMLDKDANKRLDNSEYSNVAAMKSGDKDGDGKLILTEFLSVFEGQFARLDADQDGQLAIEEWK